MFIFPLRSDRRLGMTPWVNYTLIAINVVIFLLTYEGMPRALYARYYLWPQAPELSQFFSYQFLHQGWAHLLFNMLFLYVFGNAVEDRLGKLGYLFFYLAAGVLAGVGYCMVSSSPMLGASGAIAGVTGAYLALFPLSNVTLVYWFFIIGSFEVSGMVLILFRVAQDLVFQVWDAFNPVGGSAVAYVAHLVGYLVGFVVGMGLLIGRILPREPSDMLSMIEHRRRRAQFRAATRRGFQPWEGRPGNTEAATPVSPAQQRVMDLRASISSAIGRHDMPAAARLYDELIRLDSSQVLSQRQQLDLANHLMSTGRYDAAATAYERMLQVYPRYEDRAHVQLILGLIYARYLNQRERARDLLNTALPQLDATNRDLAEGVLREIG